MLGYGYGSPFYMFWDQTYVLILIGVVLSLLASAMVRRNFARYSVVRSASGLTGAQVAQRILSYAGINDVTVCHISGNLTDEADRAFGFCVWQQFSSGNCGGGT